MIFRMTPGAQKPAVFMVWCSRAECASYEFGDTHTLQAKGWVVTSTEVVCPWDRGEG